MARMCIALKMTPEEYWRITAAEHRALVDELNAQAAEANRTR